MRHELEASAHKWLAIGPHLALGSLDVASAAASCLAAASALSYSL
jgi:hypothetical protein